MKPKGLTIFLLGMMIFIPRPLWAYDAQALILEAITRCVNTGKVVKDGMYIPQAYLSEKESCVIKQYAQQLIEAEDENIQQGAIPIITACVKLSRNKEGVDQDMYEKCMMDSLKQISNKIALPCQEIPKFMPTKVGRSFCEETVLLLLANRIKEIVNPAPNWEVRLYNSLVQKFKPVMSVLPLLGMAIYLFYLATIFWRDAKRPWQVGIVTVLFFVFLLLRFLGFLLAPVLFIVLLVPVIIFNYIPRKKKTEVDLGLHPDQLRPKKK